MIKFPGMPMVDWNSSWCSIHERTTISRTVLEPLSTSATWEGNKFCMKDIIKACLQANSSSDVNVVDEDSIQKRFM